MDQSRFVRICFFVVVMCAIVAVMPLTVRAAALRVDQLEFDVTADPGETVALSLQVQNVDDEPGTVEVYTSDWRRLPEGEHLYMESGGLPQSASPWIQVAPAEFMLDPEERTTLRFTVTVPQNIDMAGTHWGMIFIESRGRPATAGSSVSVVQRIGVKVYVTPRSGTTSRDGLVERVDARWEPESGNVAVAALFKNTGNVPVEPTGFVRLIDGAGQVVAEGEFSPFPVLPGDANLFRLTLPVESLPSGRYAVIAALDYGDAQLVGGQVQLQVPSASETSEVGR